MRLWKKYFHMQYFTQNPCPLFYTCTIFILSKFCLLPFRYNLISVLWPIKSFFAKRKYIFCAWEQNCVLLLNHCPVKIRATNIVNVVSKLFCQCWNNVSEHTFLILIFNQMNFSKSLNFKQICSWKLHVCISMYDFLVEMVKKKCHKQKGHEYLVKTS